MSQVPRRVDLVAYPLLEHLGLGKTSIGLALPDLHIIAGNAEYPSGTRLQAHLAEIVAEGTEQFLGKPGGTQQPLALRAIGNDDFWLGRWHGQLGE